MKPWLYRFAGIFVSVLFVYLAVRKVDFSQFLRVLGALDLRWLLAGALVYLFLAMPVRALRWRLILQAQKPFALRDVLVPIFVGYMANNVLPTRTGEIYRAHFLGRRAQMSRSGAMASIVVERTFDGLMLVGMMLVLFFLFPQVQLLGGAALFTALAFLAVAAGILLYGFATDRTRRAIDKMLGLLPQKLGQFVSLRLEFFLKGISTTEGLLVIGIYTVCAWLLEACAVSFVLISSHISLPLGGFVLVYALSALATTLPSGPGYVGPYQYAFVLSLGAFGISEESALAASIAAQVALFGSVSIAGLVLLWREQLRTRPGAPGQRSNAEDVRPGGKQIT